jgi:RHS repeat-associated protein
MDSGNAYIYATGVAPAEQVNLATGSATYLVTDSLGSVRGTVDGTGALTATTSYDAWGNPETTNGLTVETPFGHAGGYTDPDGLIYLLARYYDPSAGQFISVDPLVEQTLQSYAYASDNPVTNTDPSGMWTWNMYGIGNHWYAIYFHIKLEYLAMVLWSLAAGGSVIAGAACSLMALPSAAGSIIAGPLCATVFGVITSAMAQYVSDLNQRANNVIFYWRIWFTKGHWWFIPYWIPHWTYGGAATW